MTSAEQKRRSRSKLDQKGSREFSIRFSGATLQLLDGIAGQFAANRNEMLELIVTQALVNLTDSLVAELKARIDAGQGLQEALRALER